MEHIENLNNKQGGENEKLIFKILKRRQKLNLETAETEREYKPEIVLPVELIKRESTRKL